MKQINIPQDVNDVRDLTSFSEAISEINKFNKNLSQFAQKILADKFLIRRYQIGYKIPEEDWEKFFYLPLDKEFRIISLGDEEDKKMTYRDFFHLVKENEGKFPFGGAFEDDRLLYDNPLLDTVFLDVATGTCFNYHTDTRATFMGASTPKKATYEFSDNGKMLLIRRQWRYCTCRIYDMDKIGEEYFLVDLETEKCQGWFEERPDSKFNKKETGGAENLTE